MTVSDRPIFVISDLHIGDGGPRDNFGHEGSKRPAELMAFLDYVEQKNGELIILGDLFELWQANMSRVLTNDCNAGLIKRLGDMKATYVVGNHDIDLIGFVEDKLLSPALFQNMSAAFPREIGSKSFYFMHGHDEDPYNKDEAPGKGRMLTIFAGMAESFVGGPKLGDGRAVETALLETGEASVGWFKTKLKRWLAWLLLLFGAQSNYLSPAENKDRAAEMLGRYKTHKDDNDYDVAIVGHTHKPGWIGDWYFNTGSWATTNNNVVRIGSDGEVLVCEWQNGQLVPLADNPLKDAVVPEA